MCVCFLLYVFATLPQFFGLPLHVDKHSRDRPHIMCYRERNQPMSCVYWSSNLSYTSIPNLITNMNTHRPYCASMWILGSTLHVLRSKKCTRMSLWLCSSRWSRCLFYLNRVMSCQNLLVVLARPFFGTKWRTGYATTQKQ